MQTERTSKKVQGTELTKEQMNEQFNIATKELFSLFGYEHVKPSIDNLLLGWIGSDYFELKENKAVQIFDFFNKSLIYFQQADKIHEETKEISFDFFDEIMHSNFEHNYKDVKKYFKHSLRYFLEEDLANDNSLRSDVIYKVGVLRKYFKKIYEIKEGFKSENVA